MNIDFSLFSKVDLRVGKVIDVKEPSWSNKLLELTVDFETEKKTIFSGIRKWYKKEDLLNKKFIFVFNLEPKKMGESVSHGMMLMSCEAEQPKLIYISDDISTGAKLC